MCGIVGIYHYNNNKSVNADVLKEMRDSMVHRGPDAAGIWISPDRKIGLGHRRLSIIDLSDAATQPMSNENGDIWIVFNGEIYNHSEIRKELLAAGHKFKTDHSDTEVIIHAFEEWGEDCVHRFRGMFVFAVYNGRTKEVLLFRDRIGIKPLYYSIRKGCIAFASEIKALLADPDQPRSVCEEALYHYLSFMTTPAPMTLFNGIYKLPGGSMLRINENGDVKERRYWDVWDYTDPLVNETEEEISEKLLHELRIAVNYRKVSDVPVGVFLSGGIDSSINAVLFSEDETNSVNTFSIGYEKEYHYFQNELKYARVIADLVGANHHEKKLNEEDLIQVLQQLIYSQDEPIADSGCIPTYYVSRLSKDYGVTVCQVGEGSDELFHGYSSWNLYMKLQKLSNLPFTSPLKMTGLALLKLMGKETKTRYEWLRRLKCGEPIFWGGAEAFTEGQKKSMFSPGFRKQTNDFSSFEIIKPVWDRFNDKAWEKTPLNWMTYMDLNLRLPELLLMRVDKMSMATSLEARVPFLDHKVVELAMSIPTSVKLKKNNNKYILKKAVQGLIPDEIVNRKKQGFSDLLNEWFFENLGDFARKKIVNFAGRTDYFNDRFIEMLLAGRRFNEQWLILNFILWHEMWIEKKELK